MFVDLKSMNIKLFQNPLHAIFILVLFAFGCRSCETVESTKIAQSSIYQDYSIDATPNSTTVTVTFRVGDASGATVDLDAPSRIEYNGAEMSENLRSAFSGTFYATSAQDFVGRHQFAYTNGEGSIFRNEINFEPVGLLAAPQTIKRGEKITVLLTRPLTENESLETSIISEEKPPETNSNMNTNRQGNRASGGMQYSRTLYQNTNDHRTKVVINGDELRNFVPGKANLHLKVSANSSLQQKAKAGGAMSYTFTSGQFPVTISK